MTYSAWTPKMDETLAKLWEDGKTASHIGIVLGVSKNAVIGRIHRHAWISDLRKKRKPRAPPPPRHYNPIAEVAAEPEPPPPPAPPEPPPKPMRDDGLISLMQLNGTTCRWPFGDPFSPEFGYCGKFKAEGDSPYCMYHARLAVGGRVEPNSNPDPRLRETKIALRKAV